MESIIFEKRTEGPQRCENYGRNNHRKVSIDGLYVAYLQREKGFERPLWKYWHFKHMSGELETPFWIRRLKLSEREFDSLNEARHEVTKALRKALAGGEHQKDYGEEESQLRIRQSHIERQRNDTAAKLKALNVKLAGLSWLD